MFRYVDEENPNYRENESLVSNTNLECSKDICKSVDDFLALRNWGATSENATSLHWVWSALAWLSRLPRFRHLSIVLRNFGSAVLTFRTRNRITWVHEQLGRIKVFEEDRKHKAEDDERQKQDRRPLLRARLPVPGGCTLRTERQNWQLAQKKLRGARDIDGLFQSARIQGLVLENYYREG